jgi:ABC-type transporter Mla subunit MlaD
MVQIETYLDRALPASTAAAPAAPASSLADSLARLDGSVSRFDSALQTFATTTRDFREFNAHLKDNVQRLSLAFGDLSDTLKAHTTALRPGTKV